MEDFNSKYTGEEVEEILDSVEGKQDAISDLQAIREGAAKGATSVQPSDIKDVARKDSGYVIANGILDENDDYWHLPKNSLNDNEHTLASKSDIEEKILVIGDSSDEAKTNFIAVANGEKTADIYIGSVATQGYIIEGCVKLVRGGTSSNPVYSFVVIGVLNGRIIKGTCTCANGVISSTEKVIDTYEKPSTGIPKTDLAQDVQNALEKAENAVSKDKVGDMDIFPTQGFFGQSNGAVYALPNESTGDEDDILLSRDTVKTINGESIFGSGNITISGGGSSSGSGKEYIVVEPELSPTGTEAYISDIMPNTTYIVSIDIATLNIDEFSVSDALSDEYNVIFAAGMGGTTLIINSYDGIYWANGVIPPIDAGGVYELSIQRVSLGGSNYFNAVLTPFKYV